MAQLPQRLPTVPSAALGALLLAAACGPGEPALEDVAGQCGDVYGSQVCTWGQRSGGRMVAFGATVPMAAIEGAPAEMEMTLPPLPVATIPLGEAVRAATGFDHVNIFWEAHGHPPGPYLTPHWDFHFYNMTPAEVAGIDCSDPSKPAELPAGYALPDVDIPGMGTLIGLCVPAMGMHSLPEAQLTDTTLFAKTMVVGYYGAENIFVEPMIAQSTLTARRTFDVAMPAVAAPAAGVTYPARFHATYDSTAQAYRFTFHLPAAGDP
jgi:hypothetical protein